MSLRLEMERMCSTHSQRDREKARMRKSLSDCYLDPGVALAITWDAHALVSTSIAERMCQNFVSSWLMDRCQIELLRARTRTQDHWGRIQVA